VKTLGIDLPQGNGPEDLLAQPTRRRLFAALANLGGSATTDDLAVRLGLHPNGVRTHLSRMHDAGLVTRRRVPGPRGRPRDRWAIAPTARPGGSAPEAYRLLARWLARSIPPTPRRLRDVEASGREVGRELTPPSAASVEHGIVDALSALGFEPRIERAPGGRLTCVLGNCPYRDSVRENQDVVCTLHRGLTRGLLDRLDPGATLARFVPHDPDRAGCEIGIEGLRGSPPAQVRG
jgi:predicted ArsR family transcriptional regulator